jgi:hypothetical protein
MLTIKGKTWERNRFCYNELSFYVTTIFPGQWDLRSGFVVPLLDEVQYFSKHELLIRISVIWRDVDAKVFM